MSSAATFFGVSVFNLSGTINVLLFLIVRPQLLLFSPPDDFIEADAASLGQPTTGSALFNDTTEIYHHSPQPTGRAPVDDGEWEPPLDGNNVALSRIESIPRSDVI